MDVLKKILLNGFFETMVDESINKYVRRVVLILVSLCFLCGIIVLTTLTITFNIPTGRYTFLICDIALVIVVAVIYIKLYLHIKKRNKEKAKDEAIRQKIRERKEKEYEEQYEHNHRFYT